MVPLSWRYVNPGLAVAERLGIAPAELALTGDRGQQPPDAGQPERPGHRRRRAGRGPVWPAPRHLHPGGGPAGPRRHRLLALDDPDPDDTPPPGPPSATTAPRSATWRLARGVVRPCTSTRSSRTPCGRPPAWDLAEHQARMAALWAGFSEVAADNPSPGRAEATTPAEITEPAADQPDGLVPLPQAVHGQQPGRPGRGLHRAARWGRPGRPGCPRTAGCSRCRGPTPTTTGSSPNGPTCTARRRSPAGGGPLDAAGVGLDDLGARRPLLVLPLRRADGGRRARPARRRPRPAPHRDRGPDLRRRARATTT